MATRQVSVDDTSQMLFGANITRKRFALQNIGTSTVYVRFGSSPAETDNGWQVLTNGYFEPISPGTEEIHVICGSGETTTVVVNEL